jgi:capsular exopolysaccharide synthesis family protein
VSVSSDWNPTAGAYVDLEKQSLDIWALVRRRKWLVLFMLAAGIALGYLYYEKATRVYETQAQILVTKHRTDPKSPINSIDPDLGYESRLTNHIQLIRSPVVVQQAVEKFRLNELTSFQDVQPQNVASKIIGALESGRAGGREAIDTDIMQINYRSTNYVDAMTVVKAVIRSYQDFLGENYQSVSDEAVRRITQAKEELGTALSKKRNELQAFVKEAPGGVQEEKNPAEETKRSIVGARQALDSRRAQLRATLKTIETAQTEGMPIDAVMMHIESYRKAENVDAARGVQSFTDVLFPVMLEHEQLTAKYGPEHPRVKELALKMQLIQNQIDSYRMSQVNDAGARKTPEQFIATTLQALQLDLNKLDNEDKELAVQQERAEKESQYLQGFQSQYKLIRDDIKSLDDLYGLVLERVRQIEFGRNDGGFRTKTVAPPDGAIQVEPNIWKVMSVAGFIGLALGMGLAYLVDLADKSFRNPEEVRHELGMPILGHLPVIVGDTRRRKKDAIPSPVSDIVVTHHRSKSTYSEAYRAVRTALNFGIRGEGHKVIQVTSPDPGDGKSTLSANLAVCMAQSGRRVLLVDADFRRPRVHRLFGVEAGQGMSALIKGTADLPETIVPTEIDNLSLLPCGPRPSNPSELLSSTRFSELIHVLREQYDIVIIDTPPVLAVTDPCVVAPRVDGVVLLIRITKHVRPHAKRALESLESLGANLIGIVVNGVGGNRPGMGYGFGSQYGYRYAANSGYYDSYSYNYGGYHHYYDDGGETPTEEQVLRSEGYVRTPPQDRT